MAAPRHRRAYDRGVWLRHYLSDLYFVVFQMVRSRRAAIRRRRIFPGLTRRFGSAVAGRLRFETDRQPAHRPADSAFWRDFDDLHPAPAAPTHRAERDTLSLQRSSP